MKMNGGVKKEDLGKENVEAVKKGCANLGRHIENVKQFGVPVVVAINHFTTDTDAEIAGDEGLSSRRMGAEAILCKHWAAGLGRHRGTGAARWSSSPKAAQSQFSPLYPDEMPLFDKINTIVKRIYRGSEAIADKSVRDQLQAVGRRRLRQPAGLHGQDAVFLLDRPEPARRADRPRRAGPRGAPVGRRRLRRRRSAARS